LRAKDRFSYKEIRKEIERHIKKDESYASILNLYGAVFAVHEKNYPKIDPGAGLAKDEMDALLRGGRCLLEEDSVRIDPGLFRGLLGDIIATVQENSPAELKKLPRLLELEEFKSDGRLEQFIEGIKDRAKSRLERYLADQKIEKRSKVDREILSFVLLMSLIPFYSSYTRQAEEKANFDLWRRGSCPVCNQKPNMAKFRVNDGARLLGCWLCKAQWAFPRGECPFCGNRDGEKLPSFYLEEDKIYRLDACKKCRGYIKTIDARTAKRDVILDIESIVSMRLDARAIKERFRQPEKILIK